MKVNPEMAIKTANDFFNTFSKNQLSLTKSENNQSFFRIEIIPQYAKDNDGNHLLIWDIIINFTFFPVITFYQQAKIKRYKQKSVEFVDLNKKVFQFKSISDTIEKFEQWHFQIIAERKNLKILL